MISFILALASAVAVGPQPLAAMEVSQADYPTTAFRMGRQARVVFRLAVGADGVPHNCTVPDQGDAELDARSCELAITRLRFVPAHSKSGDAVAGEILGSIRWKIDARTPFKDHLSSLTLTFSGDGTLDKCLTDEDGVQGTLSTIECRQNIGSNLMRPTGDDASNTSAFTLLFTQRTAGPVATTMKQFGNLRLSSRVEWTIKPDGSLGGCLVTENFVPGISADECGASLDVIKAPYEIGEAGKLRVVEFSTYVLVQPRVPDTASPDQ